MRPPGVYRPQGDTWLLAEALRSVTVPSGARILEIGTGTGALAVDAALRESAQVTAIDVSRRAVLAARLNARLNGARIRVLHGDLFAPVEGELFDVILANPPYVPGNGRPPSSGPARAWEGGPEGRAILDQICRQAPAMLAPGATMLLVQSALSGVRPTLDALRSAGLETVVAARQREPFGPVMQSRVGWLEAQGLIRRGQRDEELVVIRAERS
jgi:release factor glutamine methyltransferase